MKPINNHAIKILIAPALCIIFMLGWTLNTVATNKTSKNKKRK